MVWIIDLFLFLFGISIGSFLNVCIIRWPLEQSVIYPPSHCFSCQKPVAWYDNLPVLSYLILRGKCRHCQSGFSARYMWIEIFTGCVFVWMYHMIGLQLILIPYLFMISCFIVAMFVDFEYRIIPDEITIGGMWFGLAFSLLIPDLHEVSRASVSSWFLAHIYSLGWGVVGVLVGGGVIWGLAIFGDWLFKKETMGFGDVKLMAMFGAFLGWEKTVLAFFLAPFFGIGLGIITKIRSGSSVIPYGPFLIAGALTALFLGDEIIYWVINGYTWPSQDIIHLQQQQFLP